MNQPVQAIVETCAKENEKLIGKLSDLSALSDTWIAVSNKDLCSFRYALLRSNKLLSLLDSPNEYDRAIKARRVLDEINETWGN